MTFDQSNPVETHMITPLMANAVTIASTGTAIDLNRPTNARRSAAPTRLEGRRSSGVAGLWTWPAEIVLKRFANCELRITNYELRDGPAAIRNW
jgi:hypothetical protein